MRILVVEDEVDLAHTLHTGLTAEGYSVDLAHDGRQGLWMARTGEYALVVLDLMLPGLNGYKVCAQLRREGNATPILVLTAKDGDWDQAEALDTGGRRTTWPNPSPTWCSSHGCGLWSDEPPRSPRPSLPWATCRWMSPAASATGPGPG